MDDHQPPKEEIHATRCHAPVLPAHRSNADGLRQAAMVKAIRIGGIILLAALLVSLWVGNLGSPREYNASYAHREEWHRLTALSAVAAIVLLVVWRQREGVRSYVFRTAGTVLIACALNAVPYFLESIATEIKQIGSQSRDVEAPTNPYRETLRIPGPRPGFSADSSYREPLDHQAVVRRLSDCTLLPPEIVERNFDLIQKGAETDLKCSLKEENEYDRLLRDTPGLAESLRDPQQREEEMSVPSSVPTTCPQGDVSP